jgi:competence protein ComEA
MTRRERRALSILLCLALAGHLLRALASTPAAPAGALQLLDPSADGNPLAHRDSIVQQDRPLGPAERIDIDQGSLTDLMRLPGIGPALARRIVADRQSHGAFGNIDGLARVKGLSHTLVTSLLAHLSFGGVPAEAHELTSSDPVDLNSATASELDALPGIGPAKARAIVAFRDSAGPFRQVADLRRVPGITAALLKRLEALVAVP